MMKSTILLLVGLLLPTSAVAFDWNGARWGLSQGEQVPYLVSESLSDDLPDEDCLQGIDLGYESWNALTCSYMRWRFDGRTANTAWGAGDGENVASWREADWGDSSAALAITSAIWGAPTASLRTRTSSSTACITSGRIFAWRPAGTAGRTSPRSPRTRWATPSVSGTPMSRAPRCGPLPGPATSVVAPCPPTTSPGRVRSIPPGGRSRSRRWSLCPCRGRQISETIA